MPDRDELLTAAAAAERLGVAESTIRSWVRKGWLVRAITSTRAHRYWWSDLLWAERRARRGADIAPRS